MYSSYQNYKYIGLDVCNVYALRHFVFSAGYSIDPSREKEENGPGYQYKSVLDSSDISGNFYFGKFRSSFEMY